MSGGAVEILVVARAADRRALLLDVCWARSAPGEPGEAVGAA